MVTKKQKAGLWALCIAAIFTISVYLWSLAHNFLHWLDW